MGGGGVMPPTMKALRRDSNENELVKAARKMGALIVYAPPLDAWVGWRGKWIPVEIKSEKGKYTDSQVDFLARCSFKGLPAFTWRDLNDVLRDLV